MGVLGLVALLATLGSASAPPPPKYTPYAFLELVGGAEVIAVGEIVELGDDAYRLRIERAIHGASAGAVLHVRRFKDWACASRFAPYAIGQRELVFARRPKDPKLGEWSAMGAGLEGEFPVFGDVALLNLIASSRELPSQATANLFAQPPFKPLGSIRGIDESDLGRRIPVPLADLEAALRGFRATVRWSGETDPTPHMGSYTGEWNPRVAQPEIDAWAAPSPFSRRLWQLLSHEPGWQGIDPAGETRLAIPTPIFALPEQLRTRVTRSGCSESALGVAMAFIDRDSLAISAPAHPSDSGMKGALFRATLGPHARLEPWLYAPRPALDTKYAESMCFGGALAALPDLDGDARPELVVGAGMPLLGRMGGTLWLVQSATASTVELSDAPAVRNVIDAAALSIDGTSVACIPSADSLQVLFGARGHSAAERGGLYALTLERSGAVRECHPVDTSIRAIAYFGTALAVIGDVDGDGRVEIAAGMPAHEPDDDASADARGALWIGSIDADGKSASGTVIHEGANGFRGRLRNTDWFGLRIAAPGDIDGDGVPDLLATSNSGVWVLFLARDRTVREHRFHRAPLRTGAFHLPAGLAVRPAGSTDERPLVALSCQLANSVDTPNGSVALFDLARDGSLTPHAR